MSSKIRTVPDDIQSRNFHRSYNKCYTCAQHIEELYDSPKCRLCCARTHLRCLHETSTDMELSKLNDPESSIAIVCDDRNMNLAREAELHYLKSTIEAQTKRIDDLKYEYAELQARLVLWGSTHIRLHSSHFIPKICFFLFYCLAESCAHLGHQPLENVLNALHPGGFRWSG